VGSGLVYNVHRWYDPSKGFYSQPDPLFSVAPLAAYRYAFSNPIRFTDAIGLQALPVPGPPLVGPTTPPIRLVPPPPPACNPSVLGTIGRGIAAAGAAFTVILNELFSPASAGEPGLSDFTDPSCKPRCGDCDPFEHGILQTAVQRACKGVPRKCFPGMSPQQLEANFYKNAECHFARREVNERCYRGGDAGHIEAVRNAAAATERCAELLTRPSDGNR
jgi:Novel toxin 16